MTPKELFVYIALTIPFVMIIEFVANIGVLVITTLIKFLFPHTWAPAWFIALIGFMISVIYGILFIVLDFNDLKTRSKNDSEMSKVR